MIIQANYLRVTGNRDVEGGVAGEGFPTVVHPPMGHLMAGSASEEARGAV